MREASLYGPIRTSGPFARNAFWYEVGTAHWSLGRRRIYMVTTAGTSLVSIEAKVRDWPAVLRQARLNLYVAEYSYAAIWHKTIPRVDLGRFDDLGIGVLDVSDSCRTVVAAKMSGLVDGERNSYVRAQCAGAAGGGAAWHGPPVHVGQPSQGGGAARERRAA